MSQTIAFIPARGGSKSIPLKNIRPFCGQPLIYWNLLALENCAQVDRVVVATDAYQIAEVVDGFDFKKVEIYRRSERNAQDQSSTESVMLEYLNNTEVDMKTTFILVQCTSPFTTSENFTSGIEKIKSSDADSLLSVCRSKRFFWNPDGTPHNYNPNKRPRRQDFEGLLMENGAFYINSVKNIINDCNRLSGTVSLYEMPEYTALELDEEDDWLVGETLFRKYNLGINH